MRIRPGYTKLVGKEVVPCSLIEWGEMLEGKDRLLWQETHLNHFCSTVFLGMDHSSLFDSQPLWFETMVFCHGHECRWDQFQDRYATYDQAEAGHKRIMEMLRSGQEPPYGQD